MKRLVLLFASVAVALLGCASEEKVDDRFNKAFEEQGRRSQPPPGGTPPPARHP